ncbi:cytochrome oxidase c assembly-domain-containing protein [Triangularia verruculosa]|uniref:Cytochrome oxidase c assembly-domain-containing protein n=1 Tax=Triangularia verruculosa TaxID=2587418 RepID=A0AAN6XGS0_9PEZI|nr:cytochrome oxidase c assembly-domain-containing protein [Triangularia verruculosa]
MPISTSPRSVSDATRFTATTPHADSKPASSRFNKPLPSSSNRIPPSGGSPGGNPIKLETPDEKVARLRAAHQRAKLANVSKLEQYLAVGRRLADKSHRLSVMALIGFSGLGIVATAYTFYDMMILNRKRKAEWVETQKQIEADELAQARLAYMTGKADEDQIALVEEVMERERQQGIAGKTSFFDKLPSGFAPAPTSTTAEKQQQPSVTEVVSWPSSSTTATEEQEQETPQKKGLWTWLTANLKKEEEGDSVMSNERRLGWESLSEEDDGTGVRDSDLVRASEGRTAAKGLKDKAREAFEKEKENERRGGPLDRIGLDAASADKEGEKKKKWWLW